MIAKKYKKVSKIGQGKFGEVFRGIYQKTGTTVASTVAIKIEKSDSPIKMIKHEATLLNYLYSNGCRTTPIVYWYGLTDQCPTMVMPFYEMSLTQWISLNHGKDESTLNSKKRLMIQMIDILDTIHSNFIIHRDIKPDNFMLKDNTSVVLIDFGLATVYVDDAKNPIPMSKNPSSAILGTPKYVSIHIHQGLDAGRRDDLISIGYIWLFMENDGYLPWENIPDNTDEAPYSEIHILHYKNVERARLKSWTFQQEELISIVTKNYINATYALKYIEIPKYKKYKEIFG